MSFVNTPGVQITETSLLPPSIVQVSTAIPVFMGYTAKGEIGKPVRITSINDFENNFGKGYAYKFGVTKDASGVFTATAPTYDLFFYEAIRLYFLNGGGACYILPVNHHEREDTPGTFLKNTPKVGDFTDWVSDIEKMDEPTLIAFPEAASLTKTNYQTLVNLAIGVCENTMDKFTLVDVPTELDALKLSERNDFRGLITANASYAAAYYPALETVLNVNVNEAGITLTGGTMPGTSSADYQALMAAIQKVTGLMVPPSALIAGVYAKVDRDNGVWKAPANVGLQGVIKPVQAISDEEQGLLNVDATAGKSINAIREFTGKGTIVWGARTLDGNSNEWRYVPVRRLFITVEESIKKATSQFVFENNDAKTWVKVSAMIKSYLNGLWKEGALMGASAEDAYFVQVGLGTTMTQEDILEGKMKVKVGLAAVRPAEFIILEFSHFMNQ